MLRRWWRIRLPTEVDKPSPARRAFLTGGFFTRHGREQLAADYADGVSPLGAVSLDNGSCLGWQRITCLSCSDACPQNAIELDGNLQPRIDTTRCNHCGNCSPVCPAGAIRIAIVNHN